MKTNFVDLKKNLSEKLMVYTFLYKITAETFFSVGVLKKLEKIKKYGTRTFFI
jgi:hypothetical protein